MNGVKKKSNIKNKSGYVGVHFSNRLKQFYATIFHEGVIINCGHSDDPRVAAKLRDKKILFLGLSHEKLQILKPLNHESRV